MSKQRPSTRDRQPAAPFRRAKPRRGADPWRRRVFKNSYTRQGRTLEVKGWAFKVQFQGRRRNFSLAARTRAEAAVEAQQLHATLVSQGWEAALALHESHRRLGTSTLSATRRLPQARGDLAYWEQRLIQRRYREARFTTDPEYSVRLEHEGAYSYFPLGSHDPKSAAAKARAIHATIVSQGWTAAFEQFEREITLGVFWSGNPAAATYTTLFTFAQGPLLTDVPAATEERTLKAVVALEPDSTTHPCLRYWFDCQPGFACQAVHRTAKETLESLETNPPALVLVNRVAPDSANLTEHLRIHWPDLPVFPYCVHEDSDQIWISISGVSGGYLFRRRLPTALFDPLQSAAQARTLTAKEATRQIRNYFQSFFDDHGIANQPLGTAALTNREQEILGHLCRGYLDKEIAHLLGISIWTVHNHVKHIYDKLGVHNRAEAVLKSLQR